MSKQGGVGAVQLRKFVWKHEVQVQYIHGVTEMCVSITVYVHK